MKPLDGVWLKVNRAKQHLESLDGEIRRFLQSGAYTVTPNPEEDTEEVYMFQFNVVRQPPKEWSVIVGELAFNLRSALDHLAWQLALLSTNDPSRQTEFPIFIDPDVFRNGAGRKMQNILPDDRDIIRELQPYNKDKRPELELLWLLHELNRIDKHQTIVPGFGQSIITFSNLPGVFRSDRFDKSYRIAVPKATSNTEMKIMADIAFELPGWPLGLSLDRLYGMHQLVSQEIVPRFTSLA